MPDTTVAQQNAIDHAVAQLERDAASLLGDVEIDLDGESAGWFRSRAEVHVRLACRDYADSTPPSPIRSGPKARSGDPSTSKLAALENLPRRQNQHRHIITLLCNQSGRAGSAEQIADALNMRLNSVSTRMIELVRSGWVDIIEPTGDEKRQRYQISTRGLLRYRIARQQEDEA
jgi:hypothetical protein